MSLSEQHRKYLNDHAISDSVIDAAKIFTCDMPYPGIVFPWSDGTRTENQTRPDNPPIGDDGDPIKYLSPKDVQLPFNVIKDFGPDSAVVIVEGTKQQYAVASYLPDGVSVYGLSGCWNWRKLPMDWAENRKIFVLFDGDIKTNRKVHDAGVAFKDALGDNCAEEVLFVTTSAQGTRGVDDELAALPEEKRARFLAHWIDRAKPKPVDKPPAHRNSNPFFNKDGLQVQSLATDVLEHHAAALTAEEKVALYVDGSYRTNGLALLSAVEERLNEQHRSAHMASVEQSIKARLFRKGLILPERSAEPILNVLNGMLDLRTGGLKPHDPSYMSRTQFPVVWNPDAQCPVYEQWLSEVVPDQVDDLEETASTMLDRSRTPSKALFAYGPSRSGKSTYIRIMEWMAGKENTSAVTLHQLSDDRFSAANVYGMALNAAADLSSKDVTDLSVFKMMTGEDMIMGNRKYGGQFSFTNTALFAFSANELPSVGESSRAYAERIKPFHFPNTFAGREDYSLETKLKGELSGILVRWVAAYQRFLGRGGYAKTLANVQEQFETRSDRVRQWVAEELKIVPTDGKLKVGVDSGSTASDIAQWFQQWAKENNVGNLGRNKLLDRVRGLDDVYTVRIMPSGKRGINVIKGRGSDPFDPGAESASEAVEYPTVTSGDTTGNEQVTTESAPGGTFEVGAGHFQNTKCPEETPGRSVFGAEGALLNSPSEVSEKLDDQEGSEKYLGPMTQKCPFCPRPKCAGCGEPLSAGTPGAHDPGGPALIGFDTEGHSVDELWGPVNPSFVRLIGDAQ